MDRIDRHERAVDAPAARIWDAVATTLAAADGPVARAGADLLGCAPRRTSGPPPPLPGAELPGFRVVATDHERRLRLEGRDHLAAYVVEFDVTDGRVAVTTWARFARGPLGAAYRFAVIGTRGHAITMKAVLRRVGRRAENLGG
jgi:hypothetical protein